MPDPITSFIGDTLFGGDDQSDAINQAAQTQKEGAAYAADIQKQMFDKQLEVQQPFLNTGYAANTALADIIAGKGGSQYALPSSVPSLANLPDYASTVNVNYDSMVPQTALPNYDEMVTNAKLVDDPTYQWRVQEGTRAANRNLASRGLSGGGQAVTSLSNLVSSIGADETGKQFDRNQSRYSAALQSALAKYGMNTDRYNATRSGQEKLYAANSDNALNLYNSALKGYGMQTDQANTNYSRLTDALKLGQGSAGSINSSSQNYGNNAGNIAMQSANNLANAQLAQGQVAANNSIGNIGLKLAPLALAAL